MPNPKSQLSLPKRTSQRDKLESAELPEGCQVPGFWETLATNTETWGREVSVSPIWTEINTQLSDWKKEYRRESGGILVKGDKLANFVGKSATRIKEKTFQKIHSAADPEGEVKRLFYQAAPVPRLEDLVRVRIETQFLDGVPFIARRILELVKNQDKEAQIERKGNFEWVFCTARYFSRASSFSFQ